MVGKWINYKTPEPNGRFHESKDLPQLTPTPPTADTYYNVLGLGGKDLPLCCHRGHLLGT